MEPEGTGVCLHPGEFHFIPPRRNIVIHFNPLHTSQLIFSVPVFVLKFSMHFPSSVYYMSHSSRQSLSAARNSATFITQFPTVKIYVLLQPLHRVMIFCFHFANNGLYCTAVYILSLYCDDWWGHITQYCGLLLPFLENGTKPELQTRIIGQRRSIKYDPELK